MILFYYLLMTTLSWILGASAILLQEYIIQSAVSYAIVLSAALGVLVVPVATLIGFWIIPLFKKYEYALGPWDEKWHISGISITSAGVAFLILMAIV